MVQIAGKNIVKVERVHDESRAYRAAKRTAVFKTLERPWAFESGFRREQACWENAVRWDGQTKQVPIMSLTTAIQPRFPKMNRERLTRWAKGFYGYDLDNIQLEFEIASVDSSWTRADLISLCNRIWDATVVIRDKVEDKA